MLVFLGTLWGVNCGQFWYLAKENSKDLSFIITDSNRVTPTHDCRLPRSTNLTTCSTLTAHTYTVLLNIKQQKSKLSCGREITIICNFLLNNNHQTSDLKQRKNLSKIKTSKIRTGNPQIHHDISIYWATQQPTYSFINYWTFWHTSL